MINNKEIEIIVHNLTEKVRIDKYLEEELKNFNYNYTRNQIQKYIDYITLNGKSVKKNTKITNDDIIIFNPPPPETISLEPEKIDFEIIYQDKDIIIINKPKGLVVHPAKGNYSGTLVNGLLDRVKDFSPIAGTIRPGIVHRLDKDTSGLMIVAKNEVAFQKIVEDFKNRRVGKEYHCICIGNPRFKEKIVENNIGRHPRHRKKFTVLEEGGKYSKTKFTVIKHMRSHSLLKVELFTGRTHQIRVHMSYLKHPIAGDPIYSRSANKYPEGLALVSKKLIINHPVTNDEMSFEIDYPEHIKYLLEHIGNTVS